MQTPAFASTKTLPTVKLLRALIWVVAVVAMYLCPACAVGQTNSSWNGGTGNWSDLGNWNPAAVPNNSGTTKYDVTIGAANSNVTMDVLNDTIDNLTLASKNSLTITGNSLSLVAGASFDNGMINNDGDIFNNALGSSLTISGVFIDQDSFGISIPSTFNNAGKVFVTADGLFYNQFGSTISTINNSGTLSNAGSLFMEQGVINNLGTLTNASGGTVSFLDAGIFNNGKFYNYGMVHNEGGITNNSGGLLTNYGTINNIIAEIVNHGTLLNTSGGTINNESTGELFNYGTVTNAGTVSNSGSELYNYGTINNSGTISNINGSDVVGIIDNSGILNNSGTINNMNGQSLTNEGTFKNSGTLFNDSTSTIGNSGTLTSPGTINNNGAFSNTGTITNRGTLNNTASATFTNEGTITNFGKVINSGEFTNGDYLGTHAMLTNDGTITNSSTMTFDSGTIVNNGTFLNRGSLLVILSSTVANNGDFVDAGEYYNHVPTTNNGTIYIKDGGVFDNQPGDEDGYLLNNGKIIDAGSMSNGVVNVIDSPGTLIITATGQLGNFYVVNTNGLMNNGTINNEGSIANDGTLTNSGTINNMEGLGGAGHNGQVSTTTLINNGVINNVGENLNDNGLTIFAGTIINRGTINDGGTIFNYSALDNRGTLNITSASVFNGPSTSSGGSFVQTAGQTIVNGTLNSAATIQIQGGKLSGTGTINGNVVLGGKISPGNSPGILTINGNYTQTASGVYDAEIAGLTPGLGYDELLISGAADLDGKLDVSFLDNFTVDLGDSFILMKYSSETGTYSMVELPKLGPGLKWDLSYDPGYLDLSVAPATVNPTPEPSTYVLWGTAGLLGIGMWTRRKFRREQKSSV
jgi:hypothetical protein